VHSRVLNNVARKLTSVGTLVPKHRMPRTEQILTLRRTFLLRFTRT
jgi:hypothetical protein